MAAAVIGALPVFAAADSGEELDKTRTQATMPVLLLTRPTSKSISLSVVLPAWVP